MASARDQMNMIKAELDGIREQIARLRVQEEVLVKLLGKLSGEEPAKIARKRSVSVKPAVIDFMSNVGAAGATTLEVDEAVRRHVPTVAKDTVGSILSRLKADGALVYDGERYYEKRFAPSPSNPFDTGLRAVN